MTVTISVPKNKLRGILRLGSLISAAIKVTLFHASDENNEPIIDTPNAISNAIPPMAFTPPSLVVLEASQAFSKFWDNIPLLKPYPSPTTIRPNNATNLAMVKVFWIIFPLWIPFVLIKVNKIILVMAYSDPTETLTDPRAKKTFSGLRMGKKTAEYLVNATATAAIVPVWITINTVQP